MSNPVEVEIPAINLRTADEGESGSVDVLLSTFGVCIVLNGHRLLQVREARALALIALDALATYKGDEAATATTTLQDGIELTATAREGWLELRAELPGTGGKPLSLYDGAAGPDVAIALCRAYAAARDIEDFALAYSTHSDNRTAFSPMMPSLIS